eukprot:8387958-Pyramimonas_sp.AAC.1
MLYGLAGTVMNKVQTRRLDGPQNRRISQIIGVRPSWLSRVSDAGVLSRARHAAASTQLLYRQMLLFGDVLRASENSLLRRCAFAPNSLAPKTA